MHEALVLSIALSQHAPYGSNLHTYIIFLRMKGRVNSIAFTEALLWKPEQRRESVNLGCLPHHFLEFLTIWNTSCSWWISAVHVTISVKNTWKNICSQDLANHSLKGLRQKLFKWSILGQLGPTGLNCALWFRYHKYRKKCCCLCLFSKLSG